MTTAEKRVPRAGIACADKEAGTCGSREFVRTGNVTCTCGKEYREHPYCFHSELPDHLQSSSVNREFLLHVTCDGRHVKL
jgi:hypothetical protein